MSVDPNLSFGSIQSTRGITKGINKIFLNTVVMVISAFTHYKGVKSFLESSRVTQIRLDDHSNKLEGTLTD